MKTNSFSFELPEELIAQNPPEERGTCRLLSLNRVDGSIQHQSMKDFPELLPSNTLVVFNNTKVRKVRLQAKKKDSGGNVEIFLVKAQAADRWECLLSKFKKQRISQLYVLPDGMEAELVEKTESNHGILHFSKSLDDEYLDMYGHIPLPPYIRRPDTASDAKRYQTIFAKEIGSSAAPTASLHFSQDILERMAERGIETAFLTLHVGLGTFAPVRTEDIKDHKMHREEFFISEDTALKVEKAKKEGRPILAVGTTSLRALESAWGNGRLKQGWQSTDIFIYPGYNFKVINQMFTNFHTPESTLLMLVSAFAGQENIMNAYKKAVELEYRFFSYGDAMWIH